MKKIVFIQNLPSPYRCHFFNSLYKKYTDFEVFYMGKTEKDRNWNYDKLDKSHPFWLDRWGMYCMLGGYHIHINPVLTFKAAFNNNIDELILAVSYCDINIVFLALLKHLRLTKAKFSFWAEANYLTLGARKDNFFKRWVRKFVYSTADGSFVVPGKMSEDTLEKWGFHNKKYIFLPNTIDEKNLNYAPQTDKEQRSIPEFLMPVRLIEEVKGVLNFFEAIGVENTKKARFIVVGDGPDMAKYKEYVRNNSLEDYILLKGFCESEEMNRLYNHVNALILPSFSDPSPLSLVEALRYHLPILCSSHCGNHYEAVNEGVNGYVFSPLDKDQVKEYFELFLSNKERWSKMGEESGKIYNEKFSVDTIIDGFIKGMNS